MSLINFLNKIIKNKPIIKMKIKKLINNQKITHFNEKQLKFKKKSIIKMKQIKLKNYQN